MCARNVTIATISNVCAILSAHFRSADRRALFEGVELTLKLLSHRKQTVKLVRAIKSP
jgi:hypothetical protein